MPSEHYSSAVFVEPCPCCGGSGEVSIAPEGFAQVECKRCPSIWWISARFEAVGRTQLQTLVEPDERPPLISGDVPCGMTHQERREVDAHGDVRYYAPTPVSNDKGADGC